MLTRRVYRCCVSVTALLVVLVAFGCARSKAWVKWDGPTDPDQLRQDIAACRAQSTAVGADWIGSVPTHTKRSVYNDCMVSKGYKPGKESGPL